MASSFIEFQQNGFWIRDGILEPAASYLYLTIVHYEPKEDWLLAMGERIKLNSWGYFNGFMNLHFDEYLRDQYRRDLFIGLIDASMLFLAQKDEILDVAGDAGAYLDEESLRIYSGQGSLERDRVIRVLQFLRKILTGEKVDDSPKSETMMI